MEGNVPKKAIVAIYGTVQWAGALRKNHSLDCYMQELPLAISIGLDKWLQSHIPPIVWNKGKEADQDDEAPFAYGAFKTVYRGHFISGKWAGHPVALKYAKAHKHMGDEIFWQVDINAIGKAIDIVRKFNAYMIRNFPADSIYVWMSAATVWNRESDDCKVLAEPLINS